MVTTFFGPESFGGDASFVDYLSRALARRGHEVEIVHSPQAFRLLAGNAPRRACRPPPPGVTVHGLETPAGWLGPVWTQQTGTPGPAARGLRRILDRTRFDVVHFHNISLLGGPGALRLAGDCDGAVRLMTLHDYWLVCPMHLMWKLGRSVCDRPQCLRCTVHGRRPPQLWRRTRSLQRALGSLDALLAPSRHSAALHRERGIEVPIVRLPYHAPAGWGSRQNGVSAPWADRGRPYFAAAGRLIEEKGFDRLVEAMASLPEFDLLLAGAGPREEQLRRRAADLPNVELLGLLSAPELAALFRGARAVVVPSLFPEPFGLVVIEAVSVGTPAIVSSVGALPELIEASGAGLVFEDRTGLLRAMRRLGHEDRLRASLAERGREATATIWSEQRHLDSYLELIEGFSRRRRLSASRRAAARRAPGSGRPRARA
jgi:glycosyltransferase involved in cell wall biosynthesis